MDTRLLLFALAASSALFWPILPDWPWLLLLVVLGGIAAVKAPLSYRGWLFAVLAGAGWMQVNLTMRLEWLDLVKPGAEVTVTGRLEHQETISDQFSRIQLALERVDAHPLWPRPQVQINVYQALPPLSTGSTLTIRAALKPAHGLGNYAGWDGRRVLLGKGITATGSLREWGPLAPVGFHWRDAWLSRAKQSWQNLVTAPLLSALVFGEQGAVSDAQWALFRATGLTHVIAISGQHIAIVAALAGWLGALWGIRPAIIAATVAAIVYSALAGFSVPTERALIMVLIWGGLRWQRREWPAWRVWLWAWVLLIVWDPWSLWSAGFWLSLLAVAIILGAGIVWRRPGPWRLQWLLMLGLLPLQLMLFEGWAPLSLLINLLALPLFAGVIIPCSLVAALLLPLFPVLSHLLFVLVDWLLDALMQALALIAGEVTLWFPLPPGWAAIGWLVIVGLLTRMLPGGRWIGLPCLTAILLSSSQPASRWQLSVLDVGQGLSVVLSQGGRALIYDTGDRYPGGYNMADAALLPHLWAQGVRVVDLLVISHKDRDHAGNRQAVLNALPVRQEISSYPFSMQTQPCQAGDMWHWQEFEIAVLWPPFEPNSSLHGNDTSCVLQIRHGVWRALLVGDIEGKAERLLVERYGTQLKSDLLIAPHHGSKTSSTAAFVAAVAPQTVVYSAGFVNRWRFPRPEVVARYQQIGSHAWITGIDGEVRVYQRGNEVRMDARREQGPWYRRDGAWWKPALWLE